MCVREKERERENLENLSKRRRMRDLHQKINTLLFSLTRLKGLFLVAFCRVVSEEHLTVCFVLLVPGTLNPGFQNLVLENREPVFTKCKLIRIEKAR